MAGYTRQSSLNNGDTITAALFNNEYNQLLAAFNATSGHKHDGTAAEGPVIALIGDAGLATPLNKIQIDTTNDEIGFHIDVSGTSTEQFKLLDGAIVPITTNDIDLGTSSLQFKDAFFDGTVTLDGLTIGSATSITDVDTDLTSVSGSDDTVASAKAIKTYVDAQVTASDLDFSGDTGGSQSIDLDSQSLTLTGGTGIDTTGSAQTMTFAIDTGVVVDKTTAQTLTNKTLTTPTISSITNGGTVTIPSGADTLVARTSTDILTNKTLTSPVINTAISGTAFKDEDNMSSDSATSVASQQSIKAYVDTQVATIPTGDITSVVAGTGMTGGGTSGDVTLNVIGGTGITANANDIAIDATVATLTGSQTLTGKTIDVDNNTVSNIEVDNFKTGAVDTNLSSVSANDDTLASAKAIKSYIDGSVSNVTASSTTTFTNKTIDADGTGNSITNIDNANIKSAAAIDATKIANGSVSNTEFQYLDGVTSAIQTQINTKQATIDSSNRLNANLVGDGSVDNTEFGYVNGVTSSIQTQIDTANTNISTKASAGFAVAMAIAL